jgi:hypothetical protein
MALKEFTTAAKEAGEGTVGGDPLTFTVDGEQWTAYPPTGGQLALVMAAQAEHSSVVEKIAGLVNFLDSILDEDAVASYRARLMDRDDPFDFDNVEAIVEWLMEEWSARPTKQPSDYRPPQRRGGRRLTATPPSVAATS